MEVKKTEKADLGNKQGLFFQMGLLLALAIVFASFQWSVSDKKIADLGGVEIGDYDFDIVPITQVKEPEQIKVKEKVKVLETLIITDEPFIDEDDPLIESEGFENIPVKVIVMPDEMPDETDDVIYIAEEMPEFPGGDKALLKFLASKTVYPEIAKENGIEGRVFVSFVVNKKGEVEQVKITRSVDPLLDREALRVVGLLPKWKAGYQGGRAVNVGFNVPINFQLN